MKIVVTGGAGFIASHIVDAYIAAGHSVVVIDDLSTGNKGNLNPKAIFYQADIRDHHAIEKIVETERPEIVNHHAALASVTASVGDSSATFEVNVDGTMNLLEASGRIGIKKFIFASTGGALYGIDTTGAYSETDPTNPASPYGQSKLEAERRIIGAAGRYGFAYLIFRYANVFGPRQNPHGEAGIVAIFSKLMAEGKQPTVYNKDATRDYAYVGDIASLNVLGLTKGVNAIYNIGTGMHITNKKIFELVAKQYGYSGTANEQAGRPGEVLRVALNAEKVKKELGWQPTVSLPEGIKKIHDQKA